MEYSKPHLGATVTDSVSRRVGRLVWLETHAFDRAAHVEVDGKLHHAFAHNLEGWGITTARYAERWLEPRVVLSRAA